MDPQDAGHTPLSGCRRSWSPPLPGPGPQAEDEQWWSLGPSQEGGKWLAESTLGTPSPQFICLEVISGFHCPCFKSEDGAIVAASSSAALKVPEVQLHPGFQALRPPLHSTSSSDPSF